MKCPLPCDLRVPLILHALYRTKPILLCSFPFDLTASLPFHLFKVIQGYSGLFMQDLPLLTTNPSKSAAGGGRTHNLRLRRPTLYPVELRLHY